MERIGFRHPIRRSDDVPVNACCCGGCSIDCSLVASSFRFNLTGNYPGLASGCSLGDIAIDDSITVPMIGCDEDGDADSDIPQYNINVFNIQCRNGRFSSTFTKPILWTMSIFSYISDTGDCLNAIFVGESDDIGTLPAVFYFSPTSTTIDTSHSFVVTP